MASVDVVVPCYNYARFLPRCIDSILSQAEVDVRALIIDDASTDDTRIVGEGLAAHDSRVLYRRHVTNKRHIATYNEGLLEWASADYSLLLSADDLLAPGALGRAVAVMSAHRDVHLVYGMALLFCDDAQVGDRPVRATVSESDRPEWRIVSGPRFVQRVMEGNPVPTPAAVVRTSTQQRIGGYSPQLPHSADMEMWMRFAAHGGVGVVPYVQAYKRTHGANMQVQYNDPALGDIRERLEAFREFLTKCGAAIGDPATIADEVNRHLAEETLWRADGFVNDGQIELSRHVLEFASQLWPAIRWTAGWRKVRVKRALPTGLLRRLQWLMDTARGGHAPEQPDSGWPARRQTGWWPHSDTEGVSVVRASAPPAH